MQRCELREERHAMSYIEPEPRMLCKYYYLHPDPKI